MRSPFRRLLARTLISLVITLAWLLQAAGLYSVWPTATFERWLYDVRLELTAPLGVDPRIVIVDIDERSLASEGYWPWGRDRVASLIYTLFDTYKSGVVAFDLAFTERDRSSGLKLLEELREGWLREDPEFNEVLGFIRPALDWDQRFAEAMRNRDVVLGYYFSRTDTTTSGQLPPAVAIESPRPVGEVPFLEAQGYTGVYGPLLETAKGAGFLDNPSVDPDGVHRRLPLLQRYEGQLYESLALSVVRALHGTPTIELEFRSGENGERLRALRFGGFRVPVDRAGMVLVPYRGGQGSFPYVSAADVLEREVPPEVLRDAIVLVGTTSPPLGDFRATPLETFYPGIEIQANMISGILDGRVRHYPNYAQPVELLVLLALGLILSVLLPQIPPLWSLLLAASVTAAVTGFNLYFWYVRGEVIPLASSYLLIAFLYGLHTVLGFVRERHLKGRLERRFGQYVPSELVEKMSEAPAQEYGFSGEIREMTVLFADLRGFTGIAETLPPHELTQFMHEWLTPMTHIIHRHGGTIDKYMGDCIMAFWGAPLDDPDHARRALEAALEMQAEIPRLNEAFALRNWPRLRLGVGVNSGDMRVGNMGSEFRVAYTVLGDAVNLGSRLESLTSRYGVPVLVSGSVTSKVNDYVYIEVDRVRVKGKQTPVVIYHPLGARTQVPLQALNEVEQYHRALEHYLRQEWDEAEQLFNYLRPGSRFARLYAVYLERIDYYRAHVPGPAWNGVFNYASK